MRPPNRLTAVALAYKAVILALSFLKLLRVTDLQTQKVVSKNDSAQKKQTSPDETRGVTEDGHPAGGHFEGEEGFRALEAVRASTNFAAPALGGSSRTAGCCQGNI